MTDPTTGTFFTPSLPQRLRSAPDLDAFMEVFDGEHPREEDPLIYLEDYLKAAAAWCDDHGAPASATKLREWLPVIEEMSDDLFTLTDEAQTEIRKAAERTQRSQAAVGTSPAAATQPVDASPTPAAPASPSTPPRPGTRAR
jgi:hypothetical protein